MNKSNNKSNNKKYNKGKSKERFDKNDKSSTTISRTNDPAWYNMYPALTNSVANIPFNKLPGVPFNIPFVSTDGKTSITQKVNVPGVLAYDVVPSIGFSASNKSALMQISNSIYSYVRHVNSGHSNYDTADLMMYILAVANACSFHSWLRRIYGTIRVVSPVNRNYPTAIAAAEGVSYSDVVANLADFRYYIDQFALRLGAYVIPSSMSLIARQVFMFEGYYQDEDDAKGQLYMYTPAGFYHLDAYGKTGTTLKFDKLDRSTNLTVANLRAYGDRIISSLVGNEDFGIMSGDIIKAFGDGGIVNLPLTPIDYVVQPSHDKNVLEQMSNIRCVNLVDIADTSLDITQNPTVGNGAIQFTPYIKDEWLASYRGFLSTDILINYHTPTDSITPELLLDWSRMIISIEDGEYNPELGQSHWYLTGIGTEIPVGMRIVNMNSKGVPEVSKLYSNYLFDANSSEVDKRFGAELNAMTANFYLSTFNYHPPVYFQIRKTKDAETQVLMNWDLHNYTVITDQDLIKMHEVAVYSELSIPVAAVRL